MCRICEKKIKFKYKFIIIKKKRTLINKKKKNGRYFCFDSTKGSVSRSLDLNSYWTFLKLIGKTFVMNLLGVDFLLTSLTIYFHCDPS